MHAEFTLTFRPMTPDAAQAVIGWRYDGRYQMYDIALDDPDDLADPDNHYFAIYHGDDLVGHAVFRDEARVPGGDYAAEALDIGAGMRPDWTGQGKGAAVIGAILDFARARYAPAAFRATIAAWNLRAVRATAHHGFVEASRFVSSSGVEFVIFTRPADERSLDACICEGTTASCVSRHIARNTSSTSN
jgi:ribosomal-protein-alanine N-acetyltransferase